MRWCHAHLGAAVGWGTYAGCSAHQSQDLSVTSLEAVIDELAVQHISSSADEVL